MKKKIIAVTAGLCLIMSMAACQITTDTGETAAKQTNAPAETSAAESESKEISSAKPYEGATIEIAVRYSGGSLDIFNAIVNRFEEESGCNVDVTSYGDDYENTMKTRMASNLLPDVFETHGWSILRYKEYLTDLSGESWVADYDESALGTITDDDGKIYVCMPSELYTCMLVNKGVCDQANVDIYSIETWDDFDDICAQIKAAGFTPIASAPVPATMANPAGTWVSYEGELAEDSAAMLDGSYDFESFVPWLEELAGWISKGYMFEDFATINNTDTSERFSSDKAAFMIAQGGALLQGCLTLNPDGDYAIIPIPASKEGGKKFVAIGEGDAFGLWKDSKNPEAAKAFMEYLTRPENANELAVASGTVNCMKPTMETDDSKILEYFTIMKEKCAGDNILYDNFWDREYMPSGMWNVFKSGMGMLATDYSEQGIQAVKQMLLENYQDLYEAAHAE